MNSQSGNCRYCSCSDEYDKMISPCDCSGSIRYVHSNCLQEWIKHTRRNEHNSFKYWKVYNFICELCKGNVRYKIHYHHWLLYDLISFTLNSMMNRKNILYLGIYSSLLYLFIKQANDLLREIYKGMTKKTAISKWTLLKFLLSLLSTINCFGHFITDYSNRNKFKRLYSLSFIDIINQDP